MPVFPRNNADGSQRSYPLLNLFFPGLPLRQVGLAMINCVRFGAPKGVLEAKDIKAQAATAVAT